MQKAIKMMALGMGMGVILTKCVCKCMPMKNAQIENQDAKATECDSCDDSCSKSKCEQLIDEFNKIDLSEVKEKTKKALEQFKLKLQSL